MFLNTGFTFKNTKGTYEIRLQPSASADYYYVHGEKHSERLIAATYEYGQNTIYTSTDLPEDSVALKFAGININKDKEIIDFCNAYGLIYANEIDAEDTNDYLFLNAEKNSFPKPTSAIGGACLFLDVFQREVIKMRKILLLYEALNNSDLKSVVEILTWFCFDTYDGYDEESLQPSFECPRFNEAFCEFIDRYDDEYDEEDSLSIRIRNFLKALEDDLFQFEHEDTYEGIHMRTLNYPDMYHTTWQALHTVFSKLLTTVDIEVLGAFGELTFSHPLTEDDINEICSEKEYVLKLGKAFLSDYFNNELMWVHPQMTFENGQFLPNLEISSLMQAMYLELFFKITPYTNLRKCANPTCNAFFEVSRDNSKRMYCSTRCAQLMAKRKQRERERRN